MFGNQDENTQNDTTDTPVIEPTVATDDPSAAPAQDVQSPPPVDDPAAEDAPIVSMPPSEDQPSDTTNDTPVDIPPAEPADSSLADDSLLSLKQDALKQLSPLVQHLDQTPEEKFRTLMMMIQATDNRELVSDAYKAAQDIPDEKAKAQALLDVINEINYFTQQHNG